MLLVYREKLNLQRDRIIQRDSSSTHTDSVLLFSELHSFLFSAFFSFLTEENPAVHSQLIRKEFGCQCNTRAVEILIKAPSGGKK